MRLLQFTVILFTLVFTTACVSTALNAAGLVYDHHEVKQRFDDQYIKLQAQEDINAIPPLYKNSHIVIASFNNDLLLAGQTPTQELRKQALEAVTKVPGINNIYDGITISKPISRIQELKDAWITTKIKTKIIASSNLDPDKVKIITENGTVYLMGFVRIRNADEYINIAKNTQGIRKVVSMLHYLEEVRTSMNKVPPKVGD